MARSMPRTLERVAVTLFRTLNTPVALSCFLLMKHREWDQLVAKTVDPLLYLDVPSGIDRFRKDTQAVDLLRKCDAIPASFDRKERALENFALAEKQCAETNYLLDMIDVRRGDCHLSDALHGILRKARKIIARVIGPVPAVLDGRFGPGTSFELKGSTYNTLADKVWVKPHVTGPACAIFEHTFNGTHWERTRTRLGLDHLGIVRGNRFTTVPKDAKTDRGICIEPLGNLYCQLGVGAYLKARLAAVGLYVDRSGTPACPIQQLRTPPRPNGQTIHRQLAARASVDGSWATIDLSNASDTVAKNLVRELFSPIWFDLLSSLRSSHTLLGNQWVRLEKFSSMGNGFTFELETLIFAGLISAVTGCELGVDLLVYGDDIIVPAHASADAVAVLKAFGFTPNARKTFTTGLFRESCGGDYFGGMDVRSVYVTSEPASPIEWMSLHNRLRRKWPWAKHCLRAVVDNIPTQLRHFGPPWLGDTVLHTCHPGRYRVRNDHGIAWVTGLAAKPNRVPLERWGEEFVVTLALLGVSSSGLTPRRNGEASYDSWRRVSISVS